MELFTEVEQVINRAYEEMLADPYHSLLPKQRVPIYRSTEILAEPVLIKFRTWLAILTARKVLPIWNDALPRNNLFHDILEVTEKLLLGSLTFEETAEECDAFYHATGNADEYIEDDNARAALKTSYSAMRAVVGYAPFSDFNHKQIEEGLPDELIGGIWADAASTAVIAYSGSAYNTDVLYEKDFASRNKSAEIVPLLASMPNEDFDPEIRKEFWEWWLKIAIPQAWELAQQSTNQ